MLGTNKRDWSKIWKGMEQNLPLTGNLPTLGFHLPNLFVGLDDGKLNTLRIPPDVNFIRYEEMLDEKIHEGRVMGVHYDSISGITYTCSEDKCIKVVERGKSFKFSKIVTVDLQLWLVTKNLRDYL